MGKRIAEEPLDGNDAYLKRQRITPARAVPPAGPPLEIKSGKQLRQLLAFNQDISRSKQAIQSFKLFLDGFAATESENAERIIILKDFFDSQRSTNDDDKESVFLNDLMQAWSFACQSNDDSLQSAVPAVLALLLRTLSSILELSEHGLRLGRTLLQAHQKDLISKGLEAQKNKDFVISPVLRLLREVSIFDGGVLAKQVFSARDHTFKALARNLSLRYTGEGVEDLRKPSVRTNALRFFLSLIKFIPSDSKRDLLHQRDVISALTRDLRDDPPFMVRAILETLKTHVLLDEALPRESKIKVVNASLLGRVSALYRYDQHEEASVPPKKAVDDTAHEFLLKACTSPGLGVLIPSTGLYPRGVDPDDIHAIDIEESFIDLGLDSIEWMDRFTEKVPTKNAILSEFIQTLRPWSNLKQSELLVAILRSAPELVADYFFGKKDFSFDPKITATWMGYSAFLFTALQLPFPAYFGHQLRYARLPPPPAIVLEHILPQPLTQKVLARCLNLPNNSLITFFAVRILCIAFGKLQAALQMYREAAKGEANSLWAQSAEVLIDQFCQRCPAIKDVILAFRRLKDTDLMQKEVTTKLLVLYYEVVPRIALDAKFGVSAALADNLKIMDDPALAPQDRVLRTIELEHLFQFAHFSPGMRWFNKVENLPVSPFAAMLKLAVEAPNGLPLLKLRTVLQSVANEHQIFQTRTEISALDIFILGLRPFHLETQSIAIYNFLDDCISRCASKPIKYITALEEISTASDKEELPVSLLSLAISEQWPFLVKSASDAELEAISQFLARYFAASVKMNENQNTVDSLVRSIIGQTPEGSPSRAIIEQYQNHLDTIAVAEPKTKQIEAAENMEIEVPNTKKTSILATMEDSTANPAEDHKALTKWTTKEVDEVIDGGHAASLIMLLSSDHLNVRKEAVVNIQKLAAKLKESSVTEKDQIWLLLCETTETAKLIIDKDPLPTAISAFASQSIAVLNDPVHILYPKINKFLSQGPTWHLDKLPLMHKIFDEQPTLDDAHYPEMGWLMSYLLAGLRTDRDMALYRKRLVFEKLLTVYNSTYLGPGLRDRILRIFFRASRIEGGSTTLVTRFSALTWLEAQIALGGGMSLTLLMEKILDSCDQKRVRNWSKGSRQKKQR